MKVVYSSSLWTRERGRKGRPQHVGWEFTYARARRVIPAIYRFPDGIVFDLLTLLDEEAYRAFVENYADKENSLSATERRIVDEEHPYQEVSVSGLTVNGCKIEEFSSSARVVTPLSGETEYREQKILRRAYRRYLRGVSTFACARYLIPYPKSFPKRAAFPRIGSAHIYELSFQVHAVTRLLPLEASFTLRVDESKALAFTHPETGVEHTLYAQKMEQEEVPVTMGIGRKLFYAMATYELSPPLAAGERLDFLTHMQYEPERSAACGAAYLPQAVCDFTIASVGDAAAPAEVDSDDEILEDDRSDACAVGVIGCADGPTAIFVGGTEAERHPVGEHGLPLHVCYAIPSLDPQECARFQLTGIEVPWRTEEEFSFHA